MQDALDERNLEDNKSDLRTDDDNDDSDRSINSLGTEEQTDA